MSRGEGAQNRGSESPGADSEEGCSNRVRNPLRADARLASLMDAWPALPEAVRAGILAMVEASTGAQ